MTMKNLISFENFGSASRSVNEAVVNVSSSIPSKAEVKVYFGIDSGGNKEKIDFGATRILTPKQIAKAGEASAILGTIIKLFSEQPEGFWAKLLKEVKKINKLNYPACLWIVQNSPKIKSLYGRNFRQVGQFLAANYALAADNRRTEDKGFFGMIGELGYLLGYGVWVGMIEVFNGAQESVEAVELYLSTTVNPQERVYPDFTTKWFDPNREWNAGLIGPFYEPLIDPMTDKEAVDSRGKKIFGWKYDDSGKDQYMYDNLW